MAVIPLILDGETRTVVKNKEDFEKLCGGREGHTVLITDLDDTQFADSRDSNVTYDLRVGPKYRDHRGTHVYDLGEKGEILLRPGGAVIIQTEEQLCVPRTMFGQIVPKVTLLQKGISNTSSKVDPGYTGPLLITVFNLGKRSEPLRRKDRLCTLCFFKVGDGARLYNKAPKAIDNPEQQPPRGRRIWDWIRNNQPNLMFIVAVASAVFAGLTYFDKATTHEPSGKADQINNIREAPGKADTQKDPHPAR